MRVRVERVAAGGWEKEMDEVAVVFPAYNEQQHVAQAVGAALAVGVGRVVCVNDCSSDATGFVINGLADGERVMAVHHKANLGKQAAVKHGLQAALRHPASKIFAVLDADMQDDPRLLPRLCRHIGRYDLVVGYRGHGDMPAIRRLSNALANLPYQLMAAIRVHDVQSGYRVYSREVALYLAQRLTTCGGYTLEHTSMLLFGELARRWGRDFRVAEIQIPYTYEGAESNIRLKDNIRLAWASVSHAAALVRLQW